jgi:hypothetical protein
MSINYTGLNAKATALIKSLGFPIKITRNGAVIGSGNAVVTPSKAKVEQGATSPSPMQIGMKNLYVTAASGFEPQVSDFVISKQGTWQVLAVEDYKPSTTTIAFRLEVQ